jgi:hypothetical protein
MRISNFSIFTETRAIVGLSEVAVIVENTNKTVAGNVVNLAMPTNNVSCFVSGTVEASGSFTTTYSLSAQVDEATFADFIVWVESNFRG